MPRQRMPKFECPYCPFRSKNAAGRAIHIHTNHKDRAPEFMQIPRELRTQTVVVAKREIPSTQMETRPKTHYAKRGRPRKQVATRPVSSSETVAKSLDTLIEGLSVYAGNLKLQLLSMVSMQAELESVLEQIEVLESTKERISPTVLLEISGGHGDGGVDVVHPEVNGAAAAHAGSSTTSSPEHQDSGMFR